MSMYLLLSLVAFVLALGGIVWIEYKLWRKKKEEFERLKERDG